MLILLLIVTQKSNKRIRAVSGREKILNGHYSRWLQCNL